MDRDDEIQALRDALRRAIAWLREHGQHPPECRVHKEEGKCSCGLSEWKT